MYLSEQLRKDVRDRWSRCGNKRTQKNDSSSNFREGIDLTTKNRIREEQIGANMSTYKGEKKLVIVFFREVSSAEQEGHNNGSLSDSKKIGLQLCESLKKVSQTFAPHDEIKTYECSQDDVGKCAKAASR